MSDRLAGLYRVRCWTHGVLEERTMRPWAAAWDDYGDAKAAHNRFVTIGRHGPTCHVDIEVTTDHGVTLEEAPL